jgi:hypothetical protein
MAGTREDAMLMVELAKWGSMAGFQEATRKIFTDGFDPDAADSQDPEIQAVLVYMETVATLVKNNLLDRELVNDWLWVEGLWDRVGPAAVKVREKAGEPRLYENFEALSQVAVS